MATRPLIKETLLLLNIYGLDPFINNFFSSLRLTLTAIVLLVTILNILCDLIFKWQGLNSMEGIAVFTSFMQILTRLCILVTNRSNFVKVIENMHQFWTIHKYGEELKTEIQGIMVLVRNIMKYMVGFFMFGMFVFNGSSFFSKNRKLGFPVYYPSDLNQSPDFEIGIGLEITECLVGGFFLLGFDFLFVSLVLNITCELKIIKKGFSNIPINPQTKGDTEECLKEVYELIEHHNLILECIKSVRRIYSFWLLNIYFYNMIEMCVCMLAIIAATSFPPSLQSLTKYGYSTIFFMMQLFFYCATGQYLITEVSESVSATVYETDWWIKTQPQLRRAFVLVLQRANKSENLTAGGMFALNLSSFRKVTRSALSFFTLVHAVYKDS